MALHSNIGKVLHIHPLVIIHMPVIQVKTPTQNSKVQKVLCGTLNAHMTSPSMTELRICTFSCPVFQYAVKLTLALQQLLEVKVLGLNTSAFFGGVAYCLINCSPCYFFHLWLPIRHNCKKYYVKAAVSTEYSSYRWSWAVIFTVM